MNPGTRIIVHNKTRLDHAFEGKHGTFIEMTRPHGFMRIHLDDDRPTANVLVHPESVQEEQP